MPYIGDFPVAGQIDFLARTGVDAQRTHGINGVLRLAFIEEVRHFHVLLQIGFVLFFDGIREFGNPVLVVNQLPAQHHIQLALCVAYEVSIQRRFPTAVFHFADIGNIVRQTHGTQQIHVGKQVGGLLCIEIELCLDASLPQADFRAYVEFIGCLPRQIRIAPFLKGGTRPAHVFVAVLVSIDGRSS